MPVFLLESADDPWQSIDRVSFDQQGVVKLLLTAGKTVLPIPLNHQSAILRQLQREGKEEEEMVVMLDHHLFYCANNELHQTLIN